MKKKDPTSHRIIEKRRRDRMNNCLADLSKLIPAHYLKKGRGRVEKTEIIEMAIKHLKDLIEISNAQDKQAASGAGQVYAAESGASSGAATALVYQLQPQAQPMLLANGLAGLEQRAALSMVEVESAVQMSSKQHLLDLRRLQAAPKATLVDALYSPTPTESSLVTTKRETYSPPPPPPPPLATTRTRSPAAGHRQRSESGRSIKTSNADKLYLSHQQNQQQPHRFSGCRQRHTCDYLNRHNLHPDGNTIGHVRHKPAGTYHRAPKLRRLSPASSSTNSDSGGSCSSSGGGGGRSSSDMSSAGYNSGANGSGSGDNASGGSAENNGGSSSGGESGLVDPINGGGGGGGGDGANKCGNCHKRIQLAQNHHQSSRNLRNFGDNSGQLQLIEQMKSNSITNGADFSLKSMADGGHHNHLSGAAAAARAEEVAGCKSAASTCAWYKKTWLLRLQSRSLPN